MTYDDPRRPIAEVDPKPLIEFRLDSGSGVPTYLQLVQQVEQALRLGHLARGDQLPRVKDVVSSLAINPNTVLKAYRMLEYRGLAVGRPGQGTFIQATLEHVGLAKQTALRHELLSWFRRANAAGLDTDGTVALFTATLREFADASADGHGRRRGGEGQSEGVA